MELEFDKEINAILRKARDSGAVEAIVPTGPHVDADAIAAFAENALPAKARLLYMEHLADCGRCRTMLSSSISPLESEAAVAAPSISDVPIVERVIPWYEQLFRTPNLAMAMGALVLAFSGLLGYLVIDRVGKSNETDVAQMSNSEPRLNGPSYDPNALSTAANTNAAAVAPADNALPAPTVASNTMTASNSAANKAASPSTSGIMGPAAIDRNEDTVGAAPGSDAPRPVMAAPPPPVSQPPAAADDRKKELSKLKDKPTDSSLAKTEDMAESRADAAKPAAKRAGSSPAMNSVPIEQQRSSAAGSGAVENTARKHVGGKTFDHREGVWYDTMYHGSATRNYRRGTDEYKKLDSGLRSIADSISGTVVLVWKERSYRIQ
ncbi:MAG: zf-HC2 domain-containing protein [Acidobacteriota bacterium]